MEMNVEKTTVKRQPSAVQLMIPQKQLENVDYFKYVGRMITDDAKCILKIKRSIAMAKALFNNKKILSTSNLLKFKEEISKVLHLYVWR